MSGMAAAGTFPRMWGKHLLQFPLKPLQRYIPTHVGENAIGFTHYLGIVGTSPRMWGKRQLQASRPRDDRYIPTHVGKTSGVGRKVSGLPVHPHACGENAALSGYVLTSNGTSPRMWGKRPYSAQDQAQKRYIPTHVGKTPVLYAGHPS